MISKTILNISQLSIITKIAGFIFSLFIQLHSLIHLLVLLVVVDVFTAGLEIGDIYHTDGIIKIVI